MKKIYLLLLSIVLFLTACEDLEQAPSNIASADSLTNFSGVLNAAYHYQQGASTSMAVMGDFRADNFKMIEAPYTDFASFDNSILSQENQFFAPFYRNLYKSILSANNVIENSTDATQVGEAKFLRALSYYKLILVFGDVSVNLSASPSTTDASVLARQPKADVYNNVIVPDLMDAISTLDNSELSNKRASKLASQALLGKVYAAMGNYPNAETYLNDAVNAASVAGVSLETNAAVAITDASSEIIFATQRSTTIADEYDSSEFSDWFSGNDTKADKPLNSDLTAAYDAAGDTSRKALSIDSGNEKGIKYSAGLENDWVEIRLADIILLLAEAKNENGTAANTVLPLLDDIRSRAGLASLTGTITTQADVKQAILDERRLELAMEGHRWFDLVRTGTVDAEMGQTINSNYHVFPIPISEIAATNGVITQNAGY